MLFHVKQIFPLSVTFYSPVSSGTKILHMIKHVFPFALLLQLLPFLLCAQSGLRIYDLSSSQLRLMKNYQKADAISRSKLFKDSIYTPYHVLWDGYMGNGDEFVKWTNENLRRLPDMLKTSKEFNVGDVSKNLVNIAADLERQTGFKAKGNWYIFYGPAWTDLGSLGGRAMIIDLSHKSNSSCERISRMFPHELCHQIMEESNLDKDTTAISSIIGEGFAVWMSMYYWKGKYSLAELLGYTEEELQLCDKNQEALKTIYLKYRYSSDPAVIDLFRNRSSKLNEKLPGAIGYYIGYCIVEAYISKHGENSFRDLFTKPSRDIAEQSGY